MLKIPFDERKCKDLITLDTLHAYYGGPVLTLVARKLSTYSQWHKFLFLCFFFPFVLIFICLSNVRLLPFAEMEAARQRALVRASVAACKQREKEGASSSASKGIDKGTSKRKNDGKDDRSLKKGPSVPVVDKQPKQPSPFKPSHGASKGLMTSVGPITQGTER